MKKLYKKPKGVIQENRTVYFNLADPEQELDYQFTYTMNFSREIRELVRARRLGLETVSVPVSMMDDTVMQLPDYAEEDALKTLL